MQRKGVHSVELQVAVFSVSGPVFSIISVLTRCAIIRWRKSNYLIDDDDQLPVRNCQGARLRNEGSKERNTNKLLSSMCILVRVIPCDTMLSVRVRSFCSVTVSMLSPLL